MKPDEQLLARTGHLLDEMINARYHGGGSALAASQRWRRVHELSDEIAAYLGAQGHSKWRKRWLARDAERAARTP